MKMVKSTPPSKKRRLLIKLVKGPRQGLTFFSTSKLDIWFVLIFMNLTLLATMKDRGGVGRIYSITAESGQG